MELKTTIFAMFMVIVFTWRNKKRAEIEGKESSVFGLRKSDITDIVPDILRKKIKNRFSKKKIVK